MNTRKLIIPRSQILPHDGGVSMVEAAISFMILLGLVGGIIDLGIGMFRYNTATYLNNSAAREAASGISPLNCPSIATYESQMTWTMYRRFCRSVEIKMQDLLGSGSIGCAQMSLRPNNAIRVSSGLYLLRATTRVRFQCFFCIFFPELGTLATTSETNIENVLSFPEIVATRCPEDGMDSISDTEGCPLAVLWPPITVEDCPST